MLLLPALMSRETHNREKSCTHDAVSGLFEVMFTRCKWVNDP